MEVFEPLSSHLHLFADSKPHLTEYGKFLKWIADRNSNETDKTISLRFNPIDPRDMRYIEILKESGLKFIQFLNVTTGTFLGGSSDTYALFEKNPIDSITVGESRKQDKVE